MVNNLMKTGHHNMRKKIQKSMILVIGITLLISYLLLIFVVYKQTVRWMEAEIRQEADYISTAIQLADESYLQQLDAVRQSTRVTLIHENGTVIYDSKKGEVALENHRQRPEVIQALKEGSGQDIRQSDTLKQEMFYYAVRLENNQILRVSKAFDNAFYTAVKVLPAMGLIAVIMLLLAWFLSKWQINRLIQPINELDLEHPLQNDIYEELTPLLQSMDKQNKEKEAIANMRKEFSANVSHELKTPLTSISGYAEIMKNGLVKQEDMLGFSERIYNEASRLIILIEDIIKLSKLDEGQVEIEKEEVDLYLLVREISSRLTPLAAKKKVHIEISGEPVTYTGIKRILDEMIYNMIENAIKYNREDGHVKVWIGNTLKGKKIMISDTGIGIPEEEQERIFERFYRVDKSHSKESGGTGLGLSIVKHGALLHGIHIQVDSKTGVGTRMEMTF